MTHSLFFSPKGVQAVLTPSGIANGAFTITNASAMKERAPYQIRISLKYQTYGINLTIVISLQQFIPTELPKNAKLLHRNPNSKWGCDEVHLKSSQSPRA